MISKKISIAVAICLAILLATVVAYVYIQMSNAQKNNETFTFSWEGDYVSPWHDWIDNRTIEERFGVTTFWMNVTFERINETNLVITVKMNDLVKGGSLGIVFDENQNGEIDEGDEGLKYGTILFSTVSSNGTFYTAQRVFLGPFRNGQRFFESFAFCIIQDIHTVDFDPDLGYTWTIPVRFRNLYSEFHVPNCTEVELIKDLIHVEYEFAVAVEFRFGMGLIE
jgi:hypothetical protein